MPTLVPRQFTVDTRSSTKEIATGASTALTKYTGGSGFVDNLNAKLPQAADIVITGAVVTKQATVTIEGGPGTSASSSSSSSILVLIAFGGGGVLVALVCMVTCYKIRKSNAERATKEYGIEEDDKVVGMIVNPIHLPIQLPTPSPHPSLYPQTTILSPKGKTRGASPPRSPRSLDKQDQTESAAVLSLLARI